MLNAQKALVLYAGVTTAALAWIVIAGAAPVATKLGELDVERINIREPDGTLRMVISDSARAPGYIVRGREIPHPGRHSAGLLFFNDEGSENGGLIFGGAAVDGRPTTNGSLSFDRYGQDQIVQVVGEQAGDQLRAGLAVNDRPARAFDLQAVERAADLPAPARDAAYVAAGAAIKPRLFVGRDVDGSAQIALRDGAGRKRLILRVTDSGEARIDFLDAAGATVRSVTPAP